MADIGLFHPNIMRSGGGEAVAVHVIQALQQDHTITLYTRDTPKFESLNDTFGVSVHGESIATKSVGSVGIAGIEAIVAAANDNLGTDLHLDALISGLIQRKVRSSGTDHDIYFSTANEFFIDKPSIQYIHFPSYTGIPHSDYETWAPSIPYKCYRWVCRRVAGAREFNTDTVLLANSKWTCGIVQSAYDHSVNVLYPPVDVAKFDSDPSGREAGFISVGTIHESKRQLALIEIIDELRANGVDTHLHIVGGVGSQSYYRRVSEKAADREYIHVEGHLERERLTELIERHRYGLHGRLNEHFGISIAEMIAGGVVPFVPTGGGQTEIVNERSELIYNNRDEAVEKISTVLTSPTLEQELRRTLVASVEEYSTDQFQKKVRSQVDTLLQKNDV